MLKVVPNRSLTLEGQTQTTGCCDADIDMIEVNKEWLVRCRKCHKYVGNVVPREIALVEAHYDQFMAQALEDRRLSLVHKEDAMSAMYAVYCNHVLKYAEQAARTTLREFLSCQSS